MPVFDRQAGVLPGRRTSPARRPIRFTGAGCDRLAEYDPRVGKRIVLGRDLSGADYVESGRLRQTFIHEVETLAAPFDAF